MPLPAEAIQLLCRDADNWHPNVCQSCLEFYPEEQMVRDEQKLGMARTLLRTAEAVKLIICKICWDRTMAYSRPEAPRVENFLLRLTEWGMLDKDGNLKDRAP